MEHPPFITHIYHLHFTPSIPVFSPNTKKYGPEKTSYLDTFHAVQLIKIIQSSARENARSNSMCTAIIMAYQWCTFQIDLDLHSKLRMIFILNSNMPLLRVRNHKVIVYNKVLGDRLGLAHYPSTNAIDLFFIRPHFQLCYKIHD